VRSAAVRWTQRHDAISEQHPALVAVHQSASGQLALLFRHALVPPNGQHRAWRRDIQFAARSVVRDLRAAGLFGRLLIAAAVRGRRSSSGMGTSRRCG